MPASPSPTMFAGVDGLATGTAAVLTNAQPLLVLLPAWWLYGERGTARTSLGLVVGFAGLIVVAVPGGGGSGAWLAILAAMAITAGTLLSRRLAGIDVVQAVGWHFLGRPGSSGRSRSWRWSARRWRSGRGSPRRCAPPWASWPRGPSWCPSSALRSACSSRRASRSLGNRRDVPGPRLALDRGSPRGSRHHWRRRPCPPKGQG